MARAVGFEPTRRFLSTVLETVSFDRLHKPAWIEVRELNSDSSFFFLRFYLLFCSVNYAAHPSFCPWFQKAHYPYATPFNPGFGNVDRKLRGRYLKTALHPYGEQTPTLHVQLIAGEDGAEHCPQTTSPFGD